MFHRELTSDERQRLIRLSRIAVAKFNAGDWQILGAETNCLDIVTGHDRLLRSLSFGDDDYTGNAHGVMFKIVEREYGNLQTIADVIANTYGDDAENISSKSTGSRMIAFSPNVFEVPDGGVERDLIAVMTPFSPAFEPVFAAIQKACVGTGFKTLRAKDIWEHSSVIQDVFSLIFRAHIVVCDFTGKNPNVFYEAGIAHTLGKHVVPITQSAGDIPFDLQHHRYFMYLNNSEGRAALKNALEARFSALR